MNAAIFISKLLCCRPARPLPAVQHEVLLGQAVDVRGQVVAQNDPVRRRLQLPKKIRILFHQVCALQHGQGPIFRAIFPHNFPLNSSEKQFFQTFSAKNSSYPRHFFRGKFPQYERKISPICTT
jgi:hypothetical protein